MSQDRTATIKRTTGETQIELTLNLDGTGQANIDTGVGFFNHMLELFTKHGQFDLTVKTVGDTDVDDHPPLKIRESVSGRHFVKRSVISVVSFAMDR